MERKPAMIAALSPKTAEDAPLHDDGRWDDDTDDHATNADDNDDIVNVNDDDDDSDDIDADDDCSVPGDRLGAAGLDSSIFAHLKRNWTWNNTANYRKGDKITSPPFLMSEVKSRALLSLILLIDNWTYPDS